MSRDGALTAFFSRERVVTAAAVCFLAALASSTIYRGPNCFEEGWPPGVETGKTHFTYRINRSCEITDVHFLVSEPEGVFDDAALCSARWSPPYAPPQVDRTITSVQYEEELQTFREIHPRRYHNRSISVKTDDGMDVQITCYFTENWQPTEAVIGYDVNGEYRNEPFLDFDSLPTQEHRAKYVQED